jgi:hypothetical protein
MSDPAEIQDKSFYEAVLEELKHKYECERDMSEEEVHLDIHYTIKHFLSIAKKMNPIEMDKFVDKKIKEISALRVRNPRIYKKGYMEEVEYELWHEIHKDPTSFRVTYLPRYEQKRRLKGNKFVVGFVGEPEFGFEFEGENDDDYYYDLY